MTLLQGIGIYVFCHTLFGIMFLIPDAVPPYSKIIRKGPTWEARKFITFVLFLFWPVVALYYLKYVAIGLYRCGCYSIDLFKGAGDLFVGARDLLPKRKVKVPEAKVVVREIPRR
jgi:hypothetical protein